VATYYYSTQCFLAWCFNHYFYQQNHWVYVGHPFYPYGGLEQNPSSSKPLRIYQNLYEEWATRDKWGATIQQKRLNLSNSVSIRLTKTNVSDTGLAIQLKNICYAIDVLFFYPIVYRVDITSIDTTRLILQNSGLDGSNEYTIPDLQENEFDLLFLDFAGDADFNQLCQGNLTPIQAVSLLEKRCP
jgi:hypothetical protein